MVNEREFNIPLDSPLDVNMSDQLVSASHPLFTYNRQKYLGGLLQTSVRYEDDGYFAGWWAHQFVPIPYGNNVIAEIGVNATYQAEPFVQPKTTSKGLKFFIVRDADTGLRFSVTPANWQETSIGQFASMTRSTPDMLTVNGTTQLNKSFSVIANIFTGAVAAFSLNLTHNAVGSIVNNVIHIEIDKIPENNGEFVTIRRNMPLEINGVTLNYWYDGVNNCWGSSPAMPAVLAINSATGAVSSPNAELASSGTAATINNPNTVNMSYSVSGLRNNTVATLVVDLQFKNGVWKTINLKQVTLVTPIIGGADNNLLVNTQQVIVNGEYVTHGIPVWFKNVYNRYRLGLTYYKAGKVVGDGGGHAISAGFTLLGSTTGMDTLIHGNTGSAVNDLFELQCRMVADRNIGSISDTGFEIAGATRWSGSVTVAERSKVYFYVRVKTKAAMFGLPAGSVLFTISYVFDFFDKGLSLTALNPALDRILSYDGIEINNAGTFRMLNNDLDAILDPNLFKYDNIVSKSGVDGEPGEVGEYTSFYYYGPLSLPICTYGYVPYAVRATDVGAGLDDSTFGIFDQGTNVSYLNVYKVERNVSALIGKVPQIALPDPAIIKKQGSSNVVGRDKAYINVALKGVKQLWVFRNEDTVSRADNISKSRYPKWVTAGGGLNDVTINADKCDINADGGFAVEVELDVETYKIAIGGVASLQYSRSLTNGNVFNALQNMTVTAASEVNGVNAMSIARDGEVVATFNYVIDGGSVNAWSWIGGGFTSSHVNPGAVEINTFNVAMTPQDVISLVAYPTILKDRPSFVVPASSMQIASQKETRLVFTNNYGVVDLSTSLLSDSDYMLWLNTVAGEYEQATDNVKPYVEQYFVSQRDRFVIDCVPAGLFQRNVPIQQQQFTVSPSSYSLVFKYGEKTYEALIDPQTTYKLLYRTKDVRNNKEAKFVFENDLQEIYMFIKQQWSDTVQVENYWWVNKDHLIELNRDDIVLKRKVIREVDGVTMNAVDDWDGDLWEEKPESYTTTERRYVNGMLVDMPVTVESTARVSRNRFLGINDIYYTVTNAKNGEPVFLKLQPGNGNIRVLWQDSLSTINYHESYLFSKDVIVPIVKRDLGDALVNNAISAYSPIDPAALISTAKISHTVIGKYLLIGIAANRGLMQWSVCIDMDAKTFYVYTGYGHVGLNGTLTGGQIPSFFMTAKGFNKTVLPLTDLEKLKGRNYSSKIDKTTVPPSGCYGTESSVWFINKSVDSIVSHAAFDPQKGTFTNITLPLRSMTERKYSSASFSSNAMFDLVVPPLNYGTLFASMFKVQGSVGVSVVQTLASILLPVLFILDPKYVMLSYINHSFGQYAYVYRNSTKDVVGATDGRNSITDRDVKFLEDKVTLSFNQSPLTDGTDIWANIILKGLNTAENMGLEAYKANFAVNQTSIQDTVGALSQFFSDNVSSTIGSLLVSGGNNISLKSTIGQSYTLDMFYSIDDKSQCFAGPGFVNHNFVGQCVAQSLTDTQMNGKRVGYWCTLKGLSEVAESIIQWTLEMIKAGIDTLIEGIGAATAGAATVIVPVGMIAVLVLTIASGAIDAFIQLRRRAFIVLGQLADAIGPPEGMSYNAGTLQKYNLAIEGTHAYGNKPMSFFYPAFGISDSEQLSFTDESVRAESEVKEQEVNFTGRVEVNPFAEPITIRQFTDDVNNDAFLSGKLPFRGQIKSVTVACRSFAPDRAYAPPKTAVVEGVETFLSPTLFKNEQIGVAPAVFGPPPIHDYEIDSTWKLGFTASAGEIIWTSCDDTKLIDGPPSNIVVTEGFCGVASSYVAVEIKNDFDIRYLRPYAVTPQAIALNLNKMNCVQEQKAYHAFDGQGNRLLKWTGGSGMDKAVLYQQYQFQVNDHFKRSNILPPSQFMGVFNGPPSIRMRSLAPGEPVANIVQSLTNNTGVETEIPGEQKNLQRFSIPVFSRMLSTLPATVRMLAPYRLNVVEGITSLTTDVRTTQTRYKAPNSVDFNIYTDAYRATDEYLCSITTQDGVVAIRDICATAGLTFVGATTREAFFWSPATRMYYSFSNGRELQKVDIMNRFLDLKEGKWDFVNQEVMFKALDKDGTIIVRLDRETLGEVFPPNDTVASINSDYRLLSMAGGTVYQGPKRFILNRFVILDYMLEDIKYYNRRRESLFFPEEAGKKNWRRVSRDYYDQDRDYGWKYVDWDYVQLTTDFMGPDLPKGSLVEQESVWWAIHGWTHNPKGLVTAMLGIDNVSDCKFEWVLTFAWTDQMDKLFGRNEYATINLRAETVTQGGTVLSEVTHVFLFKECFTRSGNAGHYTFKFQSQNGIGNRERLYLWGDSITALQDLKLRCKEITINRTQPLHTQSDVLDLIEI